jgi:hypothetical protein
MQKTLNKTLSNLKDIQMKIDKIDSQVISNTSILQIKNSSLT